MQITYKDRITNETIRQRTTGTIVQQDQTDVIKWLGHVLPMKDDRLTKSAHQSAKLPKPGQRQGLSLS